MAIRETLGSLKEYTVKQEDAWTWMVTPNNHSNHRIEVFNNGEQYEITVLENTQGNRFERGPQEKVDASNEVKIPTVIQEFTQQFK